MIALKRSFKRAVDPMVTDFTHHVYRRLLGLEPCVSECRRGPAARSKK